MLSNRNFCFSQVFSLGINRPQSAGVNESNSYSFVSSQGFFHLLYQKPPVNHFATPNREEIMAIDLSSQRCREETKLTAENLPSRNVNMNHGLVC